MTENGAKPIAVDDANFSSEIETTEGLAMVDFWAAWCGPCRMFAPTYEKVAERHPDLVFAKVDTEAQQELAAAFEIRSIPTLMIVRENVAVFAQPGALPEAALEDVIGQARALECSQRWTAAGRDVQRVIPRQPGADIANIIEAAHA
jgi:thioredoxin 1